MDVMHSFAIALWVFQSTGTTEVPVSSHIFEISFFCSFAPLYRLTNASEPFRPQENVCPCAECLFVSELSLIQQTHPSPFGPRRMLKHREVVKHCRICNSPQQYLSITFLSNLSRLQVSSNQQANKQFPNDLYLRLI